MTHHKRLTDDDLFDMEQAISQRLRESQGPLLLGLPGFRSGCPGTAGGADEEPPARDRVAVAAERRGQLDPPGGTSGAEYQDSGVRHGRQAEVLRQVDLTVGRGETVALVGANGAGKSTLLGTIMGIYRPAGGTIAVDGRRVDGWRPHRMAALGVVLVPEGRELFGHLTVRENLLLGAAPGRAAGSEVARRLEEVAERFPRLRERLRQQAGTLSGGEQQMCAIGRALMAAPKLLLLDEPIVGPLAGDGRRGVRDHPPPFPVGNDHPPGRAERGQGADRLGQGVPAGGGQDSGGGGQRPPPGRPVPAVGLPRRGHPPESRIEPARRGRVDQHQNNGESHGHQVLHAGISGPRRNSRSTSWRGCGGRFATPTKAPPSTAVGSTRRASPRRTSAASRICAGFPSPPPTICATAIRSRSAPSPSKRSSASTPPRERPASARCSATRPRTSTTGRDFFARCYEMAGVTPARPGADRRRATASGPPARDSRPAASGSAPWPCRSARATSTFSANCWSISSRRSSAAPPRWPC